jgi:hypothetical protein
MPRQSLANLTTLPPVCRHDSRLGDQERQYVYWRGVGCTPQQAVARSYTSFTSDRARHNKALELESRPYIREALDRIFKENRTRYEIDRDTVINGLMEAINVAREQSDSQNMIAGWREVAKVMGLNAPERREIKLTSGDPTPDEIRIISDVDLLKLAGVSRALPRPAIDVEPTRE